MTSGSTGGVVGSRRPSFWPFWENVRTWWEFRDLPNILFVHFANLKRDMPGQMRRIAEFLEVSVDETRWETILEYCSFDWMKRHAKSVPSGAPSGRRRPGIHQQRVNGRWAETLTPEDVAEYEARPFRSLAPSARDGSRNRRAGVPPKNHRPGFVSSRGQGQVPPGSPVVPF